MKELKFIKYLSGEFRKKSPIIEGIGDDCAVISYGKNKYTLLTCDMIIEGTHFDKKATPFQIGWKAMAVNISDIASMGGIPKYALVSVGVPSKKGIKFLKGISKGIKALSDKFNISVIGGDTNKSDKTVVNITLIGEVEKRNVIKRSGAKKGDLIFVTGTLGDGEVKHLNFIPRVEEARALTRNFKISSMIDLSDGLSMDLTRLACASKAGACVYESLIPLSGKEKSIERAISRGEDFELLFTASLRESKKIMKNIGRLKNMPITLIGEVLSEASGVKIVGSNGRARKLKISGFEHI